MNVAEAGADRTGEESINGVLEKLRADDTLLYFPPGEYYMDRQFRFSGFQNFGLYGNDAKLIPADYHTITNTDDKHKLFRLGTNYAPGKRIVVENFVVDFFRRPHTGVRAFETVAGDDLQVRNVLVRGRHDSGMWGPGRFVVRNSSGTGIVGGFMARHGAEPSSATPSSGRVWRGPTGIICNRYNRGEITFRNCQLGGFPDNGLYAGGSNGRVVIENGWYKNSNVNNVRVGGPRPVIRGVTTASEKAPWKEEPLRCMMLQGAHDARVINCDISSDVPVYNSSGIRVTNGCSGHTLVRDTKIEVSNDIFTNAIHVSSGAGDFKALRTHVIQNTPGGSAFNFKGEHDGDDWARLVDVSITGDPGHKWNRSAIYNTRNNVEFRKVTVDQGGGEKRRALMNKGDDCFLYKCDFRTNQYPVIDTARKTWVSDSYFESNRGYAGYYLKDASEDVYLRKNTIKNGIRDGGCDGLNGWGNTPDIF